MEADRVTVLYIAGSGRCGSTLLGSALEQIEGFFSPGELSNLWERGIRDVHPCGCGLPLERCAVWRKALGPVVGDDAAVVRSMIELRGKVARTRHLPLLLSESGRQRLSPALERYVATLDRLYTSIGAATGANIVVDGSKDPAYAIVLGMSPSVDLYILHLVRDPRAVAYSWQRKKPLLPATGGDSRIYMERHGPVRSTVYWVGLNAGVEAIRWQVPSNRYLLMTYEDLVREPTVQLRRIMAFLGLDVDAFPFVKPGELALTPNHSVSGNPSRFSSGVVRLQPDEEWRRRMRAAHKQLVTVLSWPLSLRYGYAGAVASRRRRKTG
jgi:hypothetical protein